MGSGLECGCLAQPPCWGWGTECHPLCASLSDLTVLLRVHRSTGRELLQVAQVPLHFQTGFLSASLRLADELQTVRTASGGGFCSYVFGPPAAGTMPEGGEGTPHMRQWLGKHGKCHAAAHTLAVCRDGYGAVRLAAAKTISTAAPKAVPVSKRIRQLLRRRCGLCCQRALFGVGWSSFETSAP